MTTPKNNRNKEVGLLDPLYLERWSPHAFSAQPVEPDKLDALFEAARWAPSCFNEQPWRFIYARTAQNVARFAEVLSPANRAWAVLAPVLVFVVASKNFTSNDKPNRWASFDAGAAWMSLALQATKLGLYAHAMGGFDVQKAGEVLGVDLVCYDVLAAIAIGYYGRLDQLSVELQVRETPSARNPINTICFEGRLQE